MDGFILWDKVVRLVGGGSVINGAYPALATPSSFSIFGGKLDMLWPRRVAYQFCADTLVTWTTLMTKQRETGRVARMMSREKKVMRWAQMPGPSSQPGYFVGDFFKFWGTFGDFEAHVLYYFSVI